MSFFAGAVSLSLCFAAGCALAAGEDALTVYKSANYKVAIPLLETAVQQSPKDAHLAAALLSSLVYEGRVDDASDAADRDAAAFPDSGEVTAARGELAFYLGDMPEAEKLFKAALKQQPETPRAVYGLYRLLRMLSMGRTARLLCLEAHQADPDDALITRDWIGYLTAEKRKEILGPFEAAHPWLYKHFEQNRETAAAVKTELKEQGAFELEGGPKETTLHFFFVRDDAQRARAVGLNLEIEGRRRLRMIFDTGATGIVIRQGAVDKAGLSHLGSFETRGIGDKGARSAFAAVADECSIGTLKFKHCVFQALEGKGHIGDEDGLIGADFFSAYVMQIDFQRQTLQLTPQPERAPNPQGYDRTIPPNEAGFSQVFRQGGHLYVLTRVNNRSAGLFLLDTGSATSIIDSTFARLFTKIHGNDYMRVKGISGEVKKVFEADKAELQFAHFAQRNLGLISIDLNNSPDHEEFRMAGIMGIPILSMFRLTIDYRNGLVNFDYVLDQHHRH